MIACQAGNGHNNTMTDAPKRRGRPPKVKPGDLAEVEIAPISDFNGAELSAFDHDGDGKPGGSLPKPLLGEHEWAAIMRECYEAYDYQDERVRFDTQGRKWTARLDKDGNNMVLMIELRRITLAYTENISTHLLGTDSAYQHIEKAMAELDRLVR